MQILKWLKNLFRLPQRQETSEVLPAWYKVAIAEIGVREIAGNAHNARILEYHKATNIRSRTDEVAWCSAFVNWCFLRCGIYATQMPHARSFLSWGKKVTVPNKGDVCVFWRGKLDSWQGHVGFYAGETETHIKVLGGNQGNEVCIKSYPKNQLLEFRRMA